jgi:hypothetical protein
MSRLIRLEKPYGFDVNFSYVERCFIDKARNAMLLQAIAHNNDYLFFTDDDQIPDVDILVKMVGLDKDIVGCPIPSRNGKKELAIYDLDGNRLNSVSETMRVGAVGMGGTLIKRQVIDDMVAAFARPFEFEIKINKGVVTEYSEDINFCTRAAELGFETWVLFGCKSIHLGESKQYYYDGEYKCGNPGSAATAPRKVV